MADKFTTLLIGVLLLVVLNLNGGKDLAVRTLNSSARSGQETASNLPAEMGPTDWQGIHAAHDEWKHTIKADSDRGAGWRATNPQTGLSATFGKRGANVTPQAEDWEWGLELVSYGVGAAHQSMEERMPTVEVSGRRIVYRWDGNLDEWYQNQVQGLEHGYTIQKRPGVLGEETPLELRMRVKGEWKQIELIDDGRGVTFGHQPGEPVVRYRGLTVIDAEGHQVVARLEREGDGQLRLVVEEQTASYPLTIDPTITQVAYLKASNSGSDDNFGWSVAISGDTAVVGANNEDGGATTINGTDDDTKPNSGAAYVFRRGTGGWTQEAYLKASNSESGDQFGSSVAISGDTIVVGAMAEDSIATGVNGNQANGTTESGAAYVFTRNGTVWSQEAYLKASNTGFGDSFGNSVAISGDIVVVGASGEDGNGTDQTNNSRTNAGAAYAFVRGSGGWTQEAYLKAGTPCDGVAFGASVAISGDLAVIGAPLDTTVFPSTTSCSLTTTGGAAALGGTAFVFKRTATNPLSSRWSSPTRLRASNPDGTDNFGFSVSISGETVVVGADAEDSNATGVNSPNTGNGPNPSSLMSGHFCKYACRHKLRLVRSCFSHEYIDRTDTHPRLYQRSAALGTWSPDQGDRHLCHRDH